MLGGAKMWAVAASMLVAFGLFLSASDPAVSDPVPYTETVIVPEVSRVISSTGAVDVRSEPARAEQGRMDAPQDARGQGGGAQIAAPAMFSAAFADHPTATVDMPQGSGVPGCEETNECFVPADAFVGAGGSVTWTNSDSVLHTVWAGDLREDATVVGYDYPDGFQSGLVNPGDEFVVEDLKEGTYPYYCSVHPWMRGTLFVADGHDRSAVEPPPRATITDHSSPYEGVCAFGAEGDLYGGKDNYVFKADISEGVATKWIIPDDLSFVACGDVDSSGRFYFTTDSGNQIMRLNPDNDSFTVYYLGYSTDSSVVVDSRDHVYLYLPEYTYVVQGERQAKAFVYSIYIDVEYDQDDDWFPCTDQCNDIEDVCSDVCGNAQDVCEDACSGSQSCEAACSEDASQCSDTCSDARRTCWDVCDAGPGRIDDNDKVYNIVNFGGSGLSGPVAVSVLSSDSSVLATSSALPRSDATVFDHIKIPVDITSGTYDSESGSWDTPPGPYSTTGRNTLVLQDLSQTASAVFEIDPDRIITPRPETLDRYNTEYYFALVSKLDPSTGDLTTFYGDSGNTGYRAIEIGASGSLYMQGGDYVAKFDPESGKLLEWYVGPDASGYGAYADKVYYAETFKHRTMLAELDTEENTLRKWTMPYHRQPHSITANGQGDVFLALGNVWLKFAPSTGEFTKFDYPDATQFETGPQDAIYWSDNRSGGSIQ